VQFLPGPPPPGGKNCAPNNGAKGTVRLHHAGLVLPIRKKKTATSPLKSRFRFRFFGKGHWDGRAAHHGRRFATSKKRFSFFLPRAPCGISPRGALISRESEGGRWYSS